LYAVLDRSRVIQEEHLTAALAFWRYCEASVRYVFGEALGDEVADRTLAALEKAGARGMTRTAIVREVFKGHVDARRLGIALKSLEAADLAHRRNKTDTGGRPRETWYRGANKANDAKEGPGCGDATDSALRTIANKGPDADLTHPLSSPLFAGDNDPHARTVTDSSLCSLSSQGHAATQPLSPGGAA
jgi:hypothetical protein